jgi:hypothetical protein
MGKGDNYRKVDKVKFDESFERVFGKKKLNVWDSPPGKEGLSDPGDGNQSRSGPDHSPIKGPEIGRIDPKVEVATEKTTAQEDRENQKPHDPGGF